MTTPPERFLRPGIEISNRVELKYAHAVRLLNDLNGRIGEWSAAENLLAKVHQVDDHSVEFRLVLKQLPPIDEWSLILGDAIHNFRSVFDSLAWAYATLDGAKPKTPGRVAFPITRSESEWLDRIRHLESIPPALLERMKKLQSWPDGEAGSESLLWNLHQLDIRDKHHGLISGAIHVNQVITSGLDLHLQPEQTAADAQLTYQTRKDPVAAENGAVVTTIRCATHVLAPDPDYVAKVDVQFRLVNEDERGALSRPLVPTLSPRLASISIYCAVVSYSLERVLSLDQVTSPISSTATTTRKANFISLAFRSKKVPESCKYRPCAFPNLP